jgi:hypothetical protein
VATHALGALGCVRLHPVICSTRSPRRRSGVIPRRRTNTRPRPTVASGAQIEAGRSGRQEPNPAAGGRLLRTPR